MADTARRNQTAIMEFILLGFGDLPDLQILLFLMFLVIYITTMAGNILIIALVVTDQHLHTPMYFFLGNLSCLETCYTSTTLPRMLASLLTGDKTISFSGCITQLYFFASLGCTECYLLAAMSYDRYLAICKPLHYSTLMNTRFCLQLAAGSWLNGSLVTAIFILFMSPLIFCGPNEIDHFYCDSIPLIKLSCSDTHLRDCRNQTDVMEFILLGFGDLPELKILLFLMFLVIYIATVTGNILITALVVTDQHLHTPMYFFLGNLSCLETCYTSTILPQMLANLLTGDKTISFSGCIIQMYFFGSLVCTECYLLAVMSYDRPDANSQAQAEKYHHTIRTLHQEQLHSSYLGYTRL
ncbi:olfactory receptor 6C75-like [Mauremys mutica]|uniref:olfactory receptor 6C75-like n=1 Tax=Mauremys mutica TaxID=74926 RepID=UPI001D16B79A|nr:olfactory receptor 6C75-like [Mauremys mutica]